jgi:Rod binding domain-containing protein
MTPTAISSSLTAQQSVDAASVTSPTPEQQKAARDFEAIFLRQLMASLEKSGGLGGDTGGGQVFRSMMVSALADTASQGGGIGLSEVILKAMLPPPPQGKPDLSAHAAAAAASHAGTSSVSVGGDGSAQVGSSAWADSSALADSSAAGLGHPAASLRWGAPSRVLTEAVRAPMLEGSAKGLAGAVREGSGR